MNIQDNFVSFDLFINILSGLMLISERLEKVSKLLNDQTKTEKELLALYNNFNVVMSKLPLDEFESIKEIYEILMSEFEVHFRTRFPNVAKKQYGAKDLDVRDKLTKALSEIMEIYDLSQNVSENKVKTGGDMIAGRKYISVYVSYKNKEQQCCVLEASQITAKDPLTWDVISYTAYLKPTDKIIKSFDGLEYDRAVQHYQKVLIENVKDLKL